MAERAAQDLVQQEREQAERLRQIRQEERDKTDVKLQEKLQHRKQKPQHTDSPELPPPRRPTKQGNNAAHRPERHVQTTYENVDIVEEQAASTS